LFASKWDAGIVFMSHVASKDIIGDQIEVNWLSQKLSSSYVQYPSNVTF